MTEYQNQTCPLCTGPAMVERNGNFGRYKLIDCRECGQYVLADGAGNLISQRPQVFKNELRAQLRAKIQSVPADNIMKITTEGGTPESPLKIKLVSR